MTDNSLHFVDSQPGDFGLSSRDDGSCEFVNTDSGERYLYYFGGRDVDDNWFDSILKYDLTTNTWSEIGSLLTQFEFGSIAHSSVELTRNGRIEIWNFGVIFAPRSSS